MKTVCIFILNVIVGLSSQTVNCAHLNDLRLMMEWHIINGTPPECNNLLCFMEEFTDMGNNVEYMESANELLFALLEHFPKHTIVAISEVSKQQKEFIYAELSKPIHDGIDISVIYNKLKLCKFKKVKHKLVLKRIENVLLPLIEYYSTHKD